jgi:hypothetical protein
MPVGACTLCTPPRMPGKLPKTTAPFGIGGIHDFNRGTLFKFNRLDSNQPFNTSVVSQK